MHYCWNCIRKSCFDLKSVEIWCYVYLFIWNEAVALFLNSNWILHNLSTDVEKRLFIIYTHLELDYLPCHWANLFTQSHKLMKASKPTTNGIRIEQKACRSLIFGQYFIRILKNWNNYLLKWWRVDIDLRIIIRGVWGRLKLTLIVWWCKFRRD